MAKDGLEWVKVSLKTERAIVLALARAGTGAWDEDSEDDEDASAQDGDGGSEGLLKQAELLVRTAQQDRVCLFLGVFISYGRPPLSFETSFSS